MKKDVESDKNMYDYLYYMPLIQMFLSAVKKRFQHNLVSVVLFGSIARRKGKKESDIDLLVILECTSEAYYGRLKPFVDIELKIRESPVYGGYLRVAYQHYQDCNGWESPVYGGYLREGLMPYFSYLIFSMEEAEENHYVFLDMIEESIVLYDKNDYFKKRLALFRERISFLGSRKILLDDGTWYWNKPDLQTGEEFIL